MFVRRFLIRFKDVPIDKESVKSGQISSEVATACRCVNIGLFLSGDLRRDVIVSIAIGPTEDLKVISYPGASLRRVSPDERSISFFLLKAIERLQDIGPGESIILDNGIELVRSSLDKLVALWDSEFIQVPSANPERFILDTNLSADRVVNAP